VSEVERVRVREVEAVGWRCATEKSVHGGDGLDLHKGAAGPTGEP